MKQLNKEKELDIQGVMETTMNLYNKAITKAIFHDTIYLKPTKYWYQPRLTIKITLSLY